MKANTTLINTRNEENQRAVREAMYMEELDSQGLTPEDIKDKARKILRLDKDAIITLEAEAILKKQNTTLGAFNLIMNKVGAIEEAGFLTKEKAEEIRQASLALSEEVARILDVEVEDLFEEVDEDFLKKGE